MTTVEFSTLTLQDPRPTADDYADNDAANNAWHDGDCATCVGQGLTYHYARGDWHEVECWSCQGSGYRQG